MVSLNMHMSVLLALFAVLTNAHFQLQFPSPRGPFVEPNEIMFCDAYNSVNTSRTPFPLSGGFYSLNSEHPLWTIGVLISTASNPTSFQNFSQVNTFAQLTGEGLYCLPLDFSTSNVTGLQSGENVTLQMVFDGGDGMLYQCADITLETTVNLSSVPCSNASVQTTTNSSSPSPSFGISTTTVPTSLVIGASVGLITLALALMQ